MTAGKRICESEEAQRAYFARERETMAKALVDHGVVVLRGFSLAREPEGFQQVTSALGLEPCRDPLDAVSARPMVDKGSAVYEAVNNGVYRAGFATTQRAYERAEADVHAGLARCVAAVWPPCDRRAAAA